MTQVIKDHLQKEQEIKTKWSIITKETIEKYGGAIPTLKEMYEDREYITDVKPFIYVLSCLYGELENNKNDNV